MKADSCSVAIALSATERELVVVDEIGGAGIGVIRVFCRNRNLTTGVLEFIRSQKTRSYTLYLVNAKFGQCFETGKQ